jgi:hypothetical protein
LGELKKKMIGTQMNADFLDAIKLKVFFVVYLRKSASLGRGSSGVFEAITWVTGQIKRENRVWAFGL